MGCSSLPYTICMLCMVGSWFSASCAGHREAQHKDMECIRCSTLLHTYCNAQFACRHHTGTPLHRAKTSRVCIDTTSVFQYSPIFWLQAKRGFRKAESSLYFWFRSTDKDVKFRSLIY
jgi:hypothetical protein